jgi:hypothetical protein
MTRHTHDKIEDVLDLRGIINNNDLLFIHTPVTVTFVLYRAIRFGGVDTVNVLPALFNYPSNMAKFLTLCGDDDIDVVIDMLRMADLGEIKVLCADVMRAWTSQQTEKMMLKKSKVI